MKKYFPWIIAIIALAAVVGYFAYQYAPSTIEKKQSDFSFKAVDKISKFRLSNEKEASVTISKNEKGEWLLNNKYPASDEALGLLFTALQRINTLGPVPVKGAEGAVKDLLHRHFKIEIYTGDDTAEKVYYVGGPTLDNKGTYMLMETDGVPAPRPYITYIPGINAYLTARYDIDTLRWRNRWVYPYSVDQIKSVEVLYQLEKEKSFTITQISRDSFSLANYMGETIAQPKQSYVQQYLGFYSSISIEAFKNNEPRKDSILRQQPYAIVRVKTTDGKTQEATVYQAPINDGSRVLFDDFSRPLKYDVEYYFIQYNNKEDFAIVQYYVWGKILRSYQEFFVKPGERK